ncbi:MAG: hypothetical protein RLZZ156_482 [Deinococcota bacterium]|jgi:hypothetical protein
MTALSNLTCVSYAPVFERIRFLIVVRRIFGESCSVQLLSSSGGFCLASFATVYTFDSAWQGDYFFGAVTLEGFLEFTHGLKYAGRGYWVSAQD